MPRGPTGRMPVPLFIHVLRNKGSHRGHRGTQRRARAGRERGGVLRRSYLSGSPSSFFSVLSVPSVAPMRKTGNDSLAFVRVIDKKAVPRGTARDHCVLPGQAAPRLRVRGRQHVRLRQDDYGLGLGVGPGGVNSPGSWTRTESFRFIGVAPVMPGIAPIGEPLVWSGEIR